jgi:hypothetical protein
VLLGSQSEGIHVDTSVRGTSVVLPGLNEVKVSAFTLREAVLTVKLELSSHDGVLTPAVEVKGRLGQNKGSGIRNTRAHKSGTHVGRSVVIGSADTSLPPVGSSGGNIGSTGVSEEARSVDVRSGSVGNRVVASEGVDGVGKGIKSVGVVEWLSAEQLAQEGLAFKRRAVVNVLVGLDNPDEFLARVVEVELDLVGRRTDRLITSELELLNQILVGVLGHASALISVKEDVVNIERSSNKGLVVSLGDLLGAGAVNKGVNSPQALINGADVKVDLDFVVLKGNEGQGETGVTAKPELEGDVEGGLREGVAGGANLAGSAGIARAINVVKRGVSDEGKLSGVTDHLEVSALLLGGHGELVPDVHPITVLAVNALATDLNLNLRDELLTWEIKPASPDTSTGSLHGLVDLGESNLKVSAVGQITIARNGASDTATEVSLAVESLFNRLHGKVSVALVGNLPESNLRVAGQVNVLSAVGNKLH